MSSFCKSQTNPKKKKALKNRNSTCTVYRWQVNVCYEFSLRVGYHSNFWSTKKLWENFHSPLDWMQVNRLQWVVGKYFCNISTTIIDWVIQWIRSTKIDRIAIYPMHRLWGNFLVLLPFDICSTKWHTVPLVNLAELPQSAQVQVWFSRSLWCPPCQESAPTLSLPHPIGYRNPWGWIPVKGIDLLTKAGVLLFLFYQLFDQSVRQTVIIKVNNYW